MLGVRTEWPPAFPPMSATRESLPPGPQPLLLDAEDFGSWEAGGALAEVIGRQVRQYAVAVDGPADVMTACRLVGCEPSQYEWADPHLHAALIPLPEGRFRIAVIRREGQSPSIPRDRFLVLHEVGHTLFYDRSGSIPERRVRVAPDAEEFFCDVFASCVLLPPKLPSRSVDEISKRYAAPVPVVKWVADENFSQRYWKRVIATCAGPNW